MTAADARRKAAAVVAALALLDWALPFGFLNGLFYKHRLFPTNLTRIFASSLLAPDTLWAILVVSASAPLFWVMAGAALFALHRTVAAWRGGLPSKKRLAGLFILQAAFFAAAELALPWMGEKGFLSAPALEGLFPLDTRGHGRLYAWLHLPALALFAFSLQRDPPSSPS